MVIRILIIIFLLSGCASGIQLSSVNPSGLKTFPLDSATKADVLAANGPPVRMMTLPNNNEAWIYEYGEGFGLKTYTVEFEKDGRVIDILYNDRGPMNGTTARKLQIKN